MLRAQHATPNQYDVAANKCNNPTIPHVEGINTVHVTGPIK